MKKRKYFLSLIIGVGVLFIIDCVSIIYCVLNGGVVTDAQKIEHTMSFVYLFIHLILLAIVFYLSFKAYMTRSQLVSVFMTHEDGSINKKAKIRAIIFGILFGLFAIYFFLLSIGLQIFLSFFSLGLKLALFNACLTVSVLAIFLASYKEKINGKD